MAKGNRKPQRQAKMGPRPESGTSSLPTVVHKKNQDPAAESSKSWWEKQREPRVSHLTVTIIVSILLALVSVLAGGTWILWDRWTDEIGDHEKTRGELAREKGLRETAITERDQGRKELADLSKKYAELEK